MAGIDDRVLARRQKDLNGFIEGYDRRLNRMLGSHMNDLAPAWQSMTKNLSQRVKFLYDEMGAINDPAKILALKNKTQRLEALASQLADDLKRMETKLQPYYTGAIKNIFEDSYYIQSFALEQAARVAVTVPMLTQSQVLGVIANPWLSDGASYSSRLRANTAYLAEKMRGAVAQAVANGWGIQEAARSIEAIAGEGYYNAVRLLRTEMNRAASLASSYSFMQNADILDGKRWNATLDAKTAPKDAANDGEIYPLDYDTPENEGVPGQRIPNHPNCRCKWTPVLSATGVSNRERIARDKDGNRTYTQARTYEEYAKEKGLPSLKGRLAKDNPAQYLRPGESLADLNKKVVYWKAPGGTVAVPKPTWEEAKKAAPKPRGSAVPNPAKKEFTATTLESAQEKVTKLLGTGKANYKGLEVAVANAVNTGAEKFIERFPQIKGFVQSIKPSRAKSYYGQYMAKVKQLANGKYVMENSISIATPLVGKLDDARKYLASDIAKNFHFSGFSVSHIKAHELAHALEHRLVFNKLGIRPTAQMDLDTWNNVARTLNSKTVAREITDQALKGMGINPVGREAYEATKYLGHYAFKDKGELFAQAIADALLSPEPRPFSAEVLKITEGMLGGLK